MSLHIVAALGYVIYGALIYAALLAWAAYTRDWFWLRHLIFGAVCAWGSYAGLMVETLTCRPEPHRLPRAPWWLIHVERGQRILAGTSILMVVAYIIALLVRR